MAKPQHTDRVIALLNRLASEHDGERAAAGLLLANMAREAQKTVAEFVRGQIAYTAFTLSEPTNIKPPPTYLDKWESQDLLADLEVGIRHAGQSVLSDWERHFADDILRRSPSRITTKQEEVIKRIMNKL